MAKRTKKFKQGDWIAAYKAYVLKYGETAKDIKTLLDFKEKDFADFGEIFDDLEELELHLIAHYFQSAMKVLEKDDQFGELDVKEQHLAFVYVLIEQIHSETLFLKIFRKDKSRDKSFIVKLQKVINQLELPWAKLKNWRPDFVDELNINPKRSLLINHALSCMMFAIEDKSKDRQDTDAYIEKTTDLLFKLTDTSTLHSLFDFGKFMYSRGKSKIFS